MKVLFKKAFFKDYENLPQDTRSRVKEMVFEVLPGILSLQEIQHVKMLRGHQGFYRIRIGNYRIGLEKKEDALYVCRVLSRKDIYRFFP